MKASELIEELKELIERYGDLPVTLLDNPVNKLDVLDDCGHPLDLYPQYKAYEIFLQ